MGWKYGFGSYYHIQVAEGMRSVQNEKNRDLKIKSCREGRWKEDEEWQQMNQEETLVVPPETHERHVRRVKYETESKTAKGQVR